ncbi:MAG: efflux RND transporter permease subunit, partial [Lachnospiraceae bacterium]|nr:efflux RND transporter permease subunit [Lachnospiraceae bacterium]
LITAMMLVHLYNYILKPIPKEKLPVDRLLARIYAGYRKLLHKLLNKRKTVVLFSVLLIVISVLLASTLNIELIPSSDEGMVLVSVNFRSGTTLESENEAIMVWEEIAAADENVDSYSVTVGSSGTSVISTGSGAASLTATLKKDRELTTSQMVDKWNELAANMTNMDVTVSATGSSISSLMSSDSYEVDLQSSDLEALKQASNDLMAELQKIDGVVKVENSVSNSSTIAKIVVDPLKAMQYGLTPIQIGVTVNNVISGISPLTITNSGSEYEVLLEYPEGQFDDLNQLLDLDISTSLGTTIPLRDIAEIKYEESQETIYRQDGLYEAGLTCTLSSDKIYEAEEMIDTVAENMVYPDGVSTVVNAMNDMIYEEFSALGEAILIAVFLVFLVMAMQFESPRFSLMVMICIPFSLVGSFICLFITRSTLSMISLMGFLMLMGIVVNNGILFVDSTNQFKQEMSVEDALVETGVIRLRPILMTTLTTILSMLPMGLALGSGENAKMMQGMALVIIGGLVASTLLTLILLPTIYMIIDKGERAKRKAEKRALKVH